SQRIIKNSELAAVTSSQKINNYLSNSIHAMKLVCHTLDNMIRDGRSNDDIADFIANQSIAIENITSRKSTGLYAFIRGLYIDETGRIPAPDYKPTESNWYIGARANIGRAAIIDAHSSKAMVTIAKILCDAKSVVAMNLSLESLQAITEETAVSNKSDMEIILDRKYQVIAHSDKSELGKNYLAASGTFGSALVNALRLNDGSYFAFNFDGEDYIAYKVPVANGWLSLSVFNATSSFRRLKNLLIFTVITSILVVSILSIILWYSIKKARIAREMQLNEKAERAAAANEAKTAFLSNMSHEIRTPINAVLGMNEMILRESSEKNILEYSENINAAGKTLLGIINDILDFSKIEAGKLEIIEADYDLSSLINDLVSMIQTRADSKGLMLKLDFDVNMPKILNGDEVRIKQAVTNILTNAVKYTQEGFVTFSINYEKIDQESVFLNFAVSDTGIGIKPEDMSKLFSEFERIEEKRNRNIEGTGLGMNITKRLLEMMNSSLNVKSVYGKGSTFSFKLKQKVVKWEALGDYEKSYRASLAEHKQYREKFTAPDAKILVVDDTPMNLMVFKSLLKLTQINIDTAASGGEGLKLALDKEYDVIFLDHMMPEKDGIKTLHELHAITDGLNINTPTVCLTANAISGARDKYLAEGFNDYLTKPIESAALEAMLIKYLPADKVIFHEELEELDEFEDKASGMSELEALYAEVQELNYNDAVKFCSGEELLRKAVEQFYRSIKQNADLIEEFLKQKDYKNYTIKVHALKSSARLIGAINLSEAAKHLEELGNSLNQEDIKCIKELTPELLASYRKFLDVFSPLYAEEEAARNSAQEISPDELNEAYETIKQFIESFDIDAIDGFISEIRKYRIPKSEAAKFAKVEECVRNVDWSGLEDALRM
nr:response regulator [Synergistaceae bacterium]